MMPGNALNFKKGQALLFLHLLLSISEANYANTASQTAGDIPPGLGISPDGRVGVVSDHPGNRLVNYSLPNPLENAVERILWDKAPISISLSVGQERMLTFPGNVRLGIPGSLTPHLRTQSQNGTVYWLASEAFAATRIQIQDIQSGQFYLVDLSATANHTDNARIEIINTTQPPNQTALSASIPVIPELLSENPYAPVAAVSHKLAPAGRKRSEAADYLTLTRHAAQQLYAPARLLKTPQGIHSAPLDSASVSGDTLIRGGGILAEPVAAWQKGSLYVTAVKLTNRTAQPITLDPRLIRGQWRTATFQHAGLGPSFSDANVTAVYLVSDRPFAEVN